jgi:ssDNA-binding Zn-finger/Zn-ribbon topoisomerase 1
LVSRRLSYVSPSITRDPRRSPVLGDVLEKGGMIRRVTEATDKAVGWVVENLPGESGSSSLDHWRRWSKDATAHRDVKPANVMASLNETDRALLATVAEFQMADGWTSAPPKALHVEAGVSKTAWIRSRAKLEGAGLLVARERGHKAGDQYQLTPAGRRCAESVESGPQRTAADRIQRSAGPLGTGDDDGLSVSMSFQDQEKEEQRPSSSTAKGGPQIGPQADRIDHALLVQALQSMRLLTTMIEAALGGAIPAPLHPASAPAEEPAGPANEHGDGPCAECLAPTVRRRNSRDEPFLGCSRFPQCRATRPVSVREKPPKRRHSPHHWGKDEVAIEATRKKNAAPMAVRDSVAELLGHAPTSDGVAATLLRRTP